MIFPGFCGGSYESQSHFGDAQRTINLYPEVIESGSGKSQLALYKAPGLNTFTSMTAGGEVLQMITVNDRLWTVTESGFYEVGDDGTARLIDATIYLGGSTYSLASNGLQIMIVADGGATSMYCYTISTESITEITTIAASWVVFLDGYFIALESSTSKIFVSGLYDGTSWDLLDFAVVATDDSIVEIFTDHRELWCFGKKNTYLYYNSGNADFPFERIQGATIESGCIGHTITQLDNTLFWCGRDNRGQGVVWRAEGYRPVRISNHSIEDVLRQSTDLDSSKAYSYSENGHQFYCLYVPDLSTTLVYDAATGLWHERDWYNATTQQYEPHPAISHCFVFGYHLVGIRGNTFGTPGYIMKQSLDYYDYCGLADSMRWLRRAPYLYNEQKRVFFQSFELEIETGVGTVSITDPTVSLRWSNNHSTTWNTGIERAIGPYADGASSQTRVRWQRLGSARNRIFEVSGSDAVPISIFGANIELTPGSH